MYVCVLMCAGAHVYVNAGAEGAFPSQSPLHFLRQGFFLRLNFTDLLRLPGQLAPREHPVSASLALGLQGHPASKADRNVLNSGPRVFSALH